MAVGHLLLTGFLGLSFFLEIKTMSRFVFVVSPNAELLTNWQKNEVGLWIWNYFIYIYATHGTNKTNCFLLFLYHINRNECSVLRCIIFQYILLPAHSFINAWKARNLKFNRKCDFKKTRMNKNPINFEIASQSNIFGMEYSKYV